MLPKPLAETFPHHFLVSSSLGLSMGLWRGKKDERIKKRKCHNKLTTHKYRSQNLSFELNTIKLKNHRIPPSPPFLSNASFHQTKRIASSIHKRVNSRLILTMTWCHKSANVRKWCRTATNSLSHSVSPIPTQSPPLKHTSVLIHPYRRADPALQKQYTDLHET